MLMPQVPMWSAEFCASEFTAALPYSNLELWHRVLCCCLLPWHLNLRVCRRVRAKGTQGLGHGEQQPPSEAVAGTFQIDHVATAAAPFHSSHGVLESPAA